ncbi:MAG: hypothetical protein HY457_01005 [Parcubacteria group bacterium]|nr:hypothetical protein [Parcubacteria group bacterium]
MTVNAEVTKNQNETNISLVRRFSKRLRGTGVLNAAKKIRFHTREDSQFKKKRWALKRIDKQKKYEKLKKLGKV